MPAPQLTEPPYSEHVRITIPQLRWVKPKKLIEEGTQVKAFH